MNRPARISAGALALCAIIPTIVAAFAVCLLPASPAACRDTPAREDVVRAMLDRSRLLEDIHVEVPVALWQEYLRDQLAGDAAGPPAPVAMIAERGQYRLNVGEGGSATLTAELRLRIFQPGKCRNLPVLSARRAWKKLTIDGKPAKLATRDGWVRFSPAEPGVYEISAGSQLPAVVAGVENSLTLPIPRAVRTLVGFESPEAWEVWVAGESARIRGLAPGGTKGVLALTPRSRLEIRCGPVRIERERPPRYRLRGQVAWNLDAGRQQIAARINVRILGGRTDRLDLSLPAGADRVRITSPDVREVQVRGARAAVFLRGRVGGQTHLSVRYELPAGKSSVKRFTAPAIRDGSWTGGTFVVTHTLGGSELLAASADGLEAIDLTRITPAAGAILAAPAVLAYRITSREFSAAVEVLNLGEFALRESIADLAHYEVALSRDGTMLCKVRYEIRNRSKQFLRLTLPRGAKVLLARVNEKPSPITPAAGASGAFLLPLVRSKASVRGLVSFPVEVVYVARLSELPGGRELSLPLPRVDLPIAYAWCELYSPRELSARRWSGPMRHVERYSTETARTQLGYGRGQLAEGFAETDRMKPGETPEPTPAIALDRAAFTYRGKLIPPAEAKPATRPTTQPVLRDERSARDVQLSLARNYWRAGKELYEKGEYKKADEAFSNVVKLAPKSVEAANAARLSSNISMLSGKLALRTKSEKAGAMQARREIEEQARELTEQQRSLLAQSAKSAGEGRYRLAAQQYKAAETLSGEIITRGGKAGQQKALLQRAESQLAAGQGQLRAQAEQTRERYSKLRAEGKYEQAREELRRLRDLDDGGVLYAGGIRMELEELAVLSARKRTKDATKDSDLLENFALLQHERRLEKSLWREEDKALVGIRGTEIPWDVYIRYPDNWKELTVRRAKAPGHGTVGWQETGKRTVTRAYDIRDLIFTPPEFAERRHGKDDAKANQAVRQEIVNKLRSLITETIDPQSWATSPQQVGVREYNGRLIVKQTPENQRQIEQMIAQLREARGPQVERGVNIARQQASGANYICIDGNVNGTTHEQLVEDWSGGQRIFVTQGGANYDYAYHLGYRGTPDADRLREYIERNYKWQLKSPAGDISGVFPDDIETSSLIQPGGKVERPRRGQAVFAVTPGQLVERMRANLGQDVQVSSRNINLPADVARALGAKFVTGNNSLRYAVVDEAQVRTLREIEAKNRSGTAAPGTARWNTQRAFVGTDAMLANGLSANVAFAGDKGNGLDVYDNPIALPHEKFILIDNNGYITAVKADPMRHWTDTAEFTPPAEVPQTIDVPRVGRMVKFEKTLVDPADGLVIRATYTWKGDAK